MQKKLVYFLVSASLVLTELFLPVHLPVNAQTVTPSPSPTPDNFQVISDLQNKIQELQGKISDLQGQEKTLSSQITLMDSQIEITQLRIQATEQQISDLTLDIDTTSKKIDTIQSSLNNLTKVLMNRVVATYEIGTIQPMQMLLTSSDVSDFLKRLDYLKIAQAHDKRLLYDTTQAKNDYQNQKNIFQDKKRQVEALKTQLDAYTAQLNQEKDQKKQLLAETQGSEANYQQILAQTLAQLSSLQGFAQSQGGASLLSNQTVCDSWGCYYNQRDTQWGGMALNNTQYSVAEVGCTMTSVAMVYTHYGHKDVTPLSINSNSSNFSGIPPALLNRHVVANGTSSNRPNTASGNVIADIDSIVDDANHDPAIVGMQYSNGNTHFVVIISGSNGSYMMNDPFTPNGHNIPFSSHYSLGMIYEVDRVTF